MRPFLVGAAGATGALARYWVGLTFGGRPFPWSTLGINVVGSFLLGFILFGPAQHRLSTTATTAIAVGFLGAFTTFSTFSVETWTLLRTDRVGAAAAYLALSIGLGVLAAGAGYALGRATA